VGSFLVDRRILKMLNGTGKSPPLYAKTRVLDGRHRDVELESRMIFSDKWESMLVSKSVFD